MNFYFDAAATTPIHPKVLSEMNKVADIFGNSGSKHWEGFRAHKKIEECLGRIADRMGTSPAHLAVTHGGTDANRKVIWAMRKKLGCPRDMWCSRVEHSSVADEFTESRQFSPDDLSTISGTPQFVAQMFANNETGRIFLPEIQAIRKKFPDSLLLVDWVQGVGKADFDFDNADFISISAHKFHGPKGVGILWIRYPEEFPELSKDTHTKDPMAVVGMAQAFELLDTGERKKLVRWTDQIETFLENHIQDFRIHEKTHSRVPGIINAAFQGVRGSELMSELSEKERICVSTGAACTSDILSPTRIMQEIEKNPEWQYPIRIGLHTALEEKDISNFCEILAHYVEELRR
ncbi:aminotransferase class V-fold PLP-dependent enzyme [Candidatus Gracilibacteria bacterium]|nr:aminotransferase class V-fold PLP-dependent enzyme [Candidatus Gracilibacteria bacterium]